MREPPLAGAHRPEIRQCPRRGDKDLRPPLQACTEKRSLDAHGPLAITRCEYPRQSTPHGRDAEVLRSNVRHLRQEVPAHVVPALSDTTRGLSTSIILDCAAGAPFLPVPVAKKLRNATWDMSNHFFLAPPELRTTNNSSGLEDSSSGRVRITFQCLHFVFSSRMEKVLITAGGVPRDHPVP